MGLKGALLCGDLQPVGELYTQDEFWQLGVTVEAAPSLLRALDQLKDHGERGCVRQASLGADRAVAHRRERAFDRVGNRYEGVGAAFRLRSG